MTSLELENEFIKLSELMQSRYFGKYRATVKGVEDPKKIGRIQVEIPDIYGMDTVSPWASPCVPFAGPKYGILFLPKKGDGVWVEFEAGDISRPIWTGSWWAENERPDEPNEEVRIIFTPGGHKITLDDKKSEIHILHSSSSEIKMTNSEIKLNIGSEIKLSKNEIQITAGGSDIKLSGMGISMNGKIVDVNNGALKVI